MTLLEDFLGATIDVEETERVYQRLQESEEYHQEHEPNSVVTSTVEWARDAQTQLPELEP